MFLGIEIGGTKLQLGVGDGVTATLTALERRDIDRTKGAQGILAQIAEAAKPLIEKYSPQCVGFGFGGPVDHASGVVRISHQVEGWEQFPLVEWVKEELSLPARLGNDCDVAALAESRYGAGRGCQHVFYVTVGTGVGGGCVLSGKLIGSGRPAIAEIGHLRPGFNCRDPHRTVELYAAGPGIAERARDVLLRQSPEQRLHFVKENDTLSAETIEENVRDILRRCGGEGKSITAFTLGQAATEGNVLARRIINPSIVALGWAIAQVITLLAPEVIVVGGGVSLLGNELFFEPLRTYVAEYAFPPLLGSYRIEAAALGEEAVVHGAVALAAGDKLAST